MKLLVTSDWHLDWTTHGVDRFEELRAAVRETVDTAIRERVDLYLFLGDLCDPDSGSSVFRCVEVAIEAATRLAGNRIQSVWMAGNHDVIEDGSGRTTLAPLCGIHDTKIHVSERPAALPFYGKVLITLPFAPTCRAYDPEKWVTSNIVGDPRDKIVIGHLSVPGIIPGEETTEMPRGREVVFPVAASEGVALRMNGHYHRRQVTPEGIHIPGSLARLTFGEEENNPGYLLVEV